MTDIEKQALALVNEVLRERGKPAADGSSINREQNEFDEILCRAIERHEAFKQEVSDAAEEALNDIYYGRPLAAKAVLRRFIIAKPVNPLVEAWSSAFPEGTGVPEMMDKFRAALAARNLEIVEKKKP